MKFLFWLQSHLVTGANYLAALPHILMWLEIFISVLVIIVFIAFIYAILEYEKIQKVKKADPEYAEYRRLYEKFGRI